MRRLLAMLMAAILAMTLCTAVSEEETEEVLYYLTSFDCEDLDGNPVDISIFDGAQLVLIDCWEAWCHWCLEEMPDLNELYELNKDNGLMIVGLSGLSPAERFDPKATAEDLKITYPLVNGTAELLPFVPEGFPTTLVYQRQEDGSLLLLGYIPGYLPREQWNQLLQEFLPGAVTEAVSDQ